MEKAQGIQMNNLMKMLKDYKSNPSTFAENDKLFCRKLQRTCKIFC